MNEIEINELRVPCFVGVSDQEISHPQVLVFDVCLHSMQNWSTLDDNIANTIDYVSVIQAVETLVKSRPRRLIETMAEEIADMLLKTFPVSSCRVRIQKNILPQTRSVAVVVTRSV